MPRYLIERLFDQRKGKLGPATSQRAIRLTEENFPELAWEHCMSSSLAHGGEGLGTLGLHEPKLRELCAEAGFSTVRRVPVENPVNSLFDIRA